MNSQVSFDGKRAVYFGIQVAPGANLLDVIKGVRDIFPGIQAQLPHGMTGTIVYDSTEFVNSSIHEVITHVGRGGADRHAGGVRIPRFAAFGADPGDRDSAVADRHLHFDAGFGFSINLLTLLALVLAIGLVVDDAIIVVENVNRHLEQGMRPIPAAIQAARELGGPIIAMTVVLIAVYVPIGFQGGLTGALFTEFAFTLVGAVTVSAIIALTLSPMLCSRFLAPHTADRSGWEARLVDFIDRRFASLHRRYERRLHNSLNFLPVTLVFAAIVLGSIFFLYNSATSELAPQEDEGVVIALATPAPNATLQQRLMYDHQIDQVFTSFPETDHVFQLDVPGQNIGGMVLKPWDQRVRTTNQLQPQVQQALSGIAGFRAVAFQPPSLPGSNGLPIQFAIETTQSFDALNGVAQQFLQRARASGLFIFVDSDLRIDQPQSTVVIDRDKAASLGLSMKDIGAALGSMLGGGYVNYFSLDGRSYKVIPQVEQRFRLNTDQLLNYYIRTDNGDLGAAIDRGAYRHPDGARSAQPLSAAQFRDDRRRAVPRRRVGHRGGLPDQAGEADAAAGLYGRLWRAVAAVCAGVLRLRRYLRFRADHHLPVARGTVRELPRSADHPGLGADVDRRRIVVRQHGIGGATLNIYTEVGLVTLMGLISKHGILIVEFANELQKEGRTKRQAIEEAAGIRLRPILMTTAAMVLGVIPLLTASGAGAVSRFDMGLVIASGLGVGTLFTLFVVPAVYMLLAADHHVVRAAEEPVRRQVEPVTGSSLR